MAIVSNKFLLNTWMGIGIKHGGFLGFIGGESTNGRFFSLYDPMAFQAGFSLTNARLGIGLGGSAGAVLMMAFNCPNLWRLNGEPASDWGLNITMGKRWSELLTALQHHKMIPIVANVAKSLKNSPSGVLQLEGLESCRNFLHYIYNAWDLGLMDNKPKFMSIDIPLTGKGLEISATYSFGGRIYILG